MARILLSLMVALTLAGCQQAAQPKHVSAQSIALQPGDVSDLQRCDGSGDLQTVLREERSSNPIGYYQNATEWEQWKTQGAIEAYFAAYGRTSADCNALTTVGAGAPSGGLMAALVVKFKNPTIAARTYQAGSTLLGFGPKDITFIRLAGGGVLTGVDTGLGPRSVIGSGSVADTTYYFAFWQNKMVDSFFIAYDLPAAEAEGATKRVNQRIS
jgi:hypothetical protein